MHLRKFVLQPLADIRPDLIVPGQRKTAGQLLTEFKRSRDVVRFKASW
jgi:7,8-dihydro-6-hydroxymethylpterin-pyrophosphokinase